MKTIYNNSFFFSKFTAVLQQFSISSGMIRCRLSLCFYLVWPFEMVVQKREMCNLLEGKRVSE